MMFVLFVCVFNTFVITGNNSNDELGLTVHSKDNLLRVTVTSPEYDTKQSDEDRLGATICCVVDISGSMSTEVTVKNDNGQTESHRLTILDKMN